MNNYQNKLLSHRFRGFPGHEHSPENFKKLNSQKIKYFELDTRVSKDGVIYVSHSHAFRAAGKTHKIADLDSVKIDTLNQHKDNGLLTLSTVLQLFSRYANQNQRLCIDIKDCGFEKEHLDLVKEFHLDQQVYFISWIPQVILGLNQLEANIPLVFSFWNVNRLKLLGKLITHMLREKVDPLGPYIVVGQDRIADPLEKLSIGYQHALFSTELPSLLLPVLINSGGGICIHKTMYCRSVGEYCKTNSIQLWIYNENSSNHFKKLADNEHIHVIFSDKAPEISQSL